MEINGKSMRQASEREVWYFNKVKSLKEIGQYEKCIDMSDIALRSIKAFHNNEDMWIIYYASYSLYALIAGMNARPMLAASRELSIGALLTRRMLRTGLLKSRLS